VVGEGGATNFKVGVNALESGINTVKTLKFEKGVAPPQLLWWHHPWGDDRK